MHKVDLLRQLVEAISMHITSSKVRYWKILDAI
jgi:hypothetical protein